MDPSNRNKIVIRPFRRIPVIKTNASTLIPHSCTHGCYEKIKNVINRTKALEDKVDKLYNTVALMLNNPLNPFPPTGRRLSMVSAAAALAQSSSKAPSFELKGKKLVLRKVPEINDENRRTRMGEIAVGSEENSGPPSPVTYKDTNYTEEGCSASKRRRIGCESIPTASSVTPFDDENGHEVVESPPPELDAQVGMMAPDLDDVSDSGVDEDDELRALFKSSKWLQQNQDWSSFIHPREKRDLTSDEVGLLVDRHILLGPTRATVGSFRDHYDEVEWTHNLDDNVIEESLRRLCGIGILMNTNDVVFKKKDAESFGDFKKFSLLLAQRAIRLPEYQQTFLPGF